MQRPGKRDPAGGAGSQRARLSTHTFMVHLADCRAGGETVLLLRGELLARWEAKG